jgi:hypothetical protein
MQLPQGSGMRPQHVHKLLVASAPAAIPAQQHLVVEKEKKKKSKDWRRFVSRFFLLFLFLFFLLSSVFHATTVF